MTRLSATGWRVRAGTTTEQQQKMDSKRGCGLIVKEDVAVQ
jgi:hypothetical protein